MSEYKFNVGDIVLRITDNYCNVVCGVEYIVENVHPNGNIDAGGEKGLMKERFKLVKAAKPSYPNPPHKHAELIKAWADGADIEYQSRASGGWYCAVEPDWSSKFKFRIKPTKSDKEIQIEKLEQQAKDLAKEISKLKES